MVTNSINTSLNLFKHLQSKEVEPFDFDRRHVTSGNSLGEATETVYGRGDSALTEIVYR